MILNPDGYADASVFELLAEAERGYVPLDRRLARTLVERGDSIFPDFIRYLEEPCEDERLDLDVCVFALDVARQLRTPAALPFLAEQARRDAFEFSDELTEAFVELGEASVETLLGLYDESDGAPDVRFAMAGLGVRHPRILETLLDLLEADPAEGSIVLGLYGDPAAKPALEKALAAAGDNERLRQEIEGAIREIDGADATHPEPFDIWPLYPEEETPFFAAFETAELLKFLASPVPEYRLRAVKMLTFEEPPPEIARRVLEVAKTDPDMGVRAMAWECLEGIHEPAEIEKAVRARVEDAEAPVEERAGALVALAHEARDDEALHRLILEFYERPETRERAVRAMWHSGDRRFESRIPEAFGDPDLGVRRQAVTAAGMFGMVGQLGRMERLFEDGDLRDTALYAYALAAPGPVTPARMRGLYTRIEDLAGGLNEQEGAIVGKALDDRLEAHDQPPVFHIEEDREAEEEDAPPLTEAKPAKVGRNDPCPCGSGKKYKKCCGQ
ncbi:MAG: SEC-C metal-binding domain-containing protein [Bryobacteraceae bacterium]